MLVLFCWVFVRVLGLVLLSFCCLYCVFTWMRACLRLIGCWLVGLIVRSLRALMCVMVL